MPKALLITLVLVAGYLLGTLHTPARAHEERDPKQGEQMQQQLHLLGQLVQLQKQQADALTTLADIEKNARTDRDQADSLRTLARTMSSDIVRAERDQADALKAMVQAVERLKPR